MTLGLGALCSPCSGWAILLMDKWLDFSTLYLTLPRNAAPPSSTSHILQQSLNQTCLSNFYLLRNPTLAGIVSWSSMEGVLLHLELGRASSAPSSLNTVNLPKTSTGTSSVPSFHCLQADGDPRQVTASHSFHLLRFNMRQ